MAALVRSALTDFHPYPSSRQQPAVRAPGLLHRFERTLRLWQRRIRERQELAAFSHWDMRDIGVTPSEVWNEVRQPFWRSSLDR